MLIAPCNSYYYLFSSSDIPLTIFIVIDFSRWRIRVYRKVFYGSEFVSWLIEVGLSKDRMEAVHYARHLVDGRVLRHINNVYHFEDKQLLYNFCSRI